MGQKNDNTNLLIFEFFIKYKFHISTHYGYIHFKSSSDQKKFTAEETSLN